MTSATFANQLNPKWRAHLASTWEHIDIALWDWQIPQDYVYFSTQWIAMLGYQENEIAANSNAFFNLIHPDDLQNVQKKIAAHFSNPEQHPYEVDIRIKCKSGEYKWVRSKGKVLLDCHGKPERMIGTHSDITESNYYLNSITHLEQRYKSMFELHGAMMILVEPKTGSIIDANHSAQRFYGFSHSEFLTLKIQDINALPNHEVKKLRARALARTETQFVFPHRLKDNSIRLIEVTASPIDTENGPLIFSILRDVTASIENESLLANARNEAEQQRKNLASIAENVPGIIFTYQVFKDGTSAFPYASDNIKTIFGLSAEQVKSDASVLFKAIHPQDFHWVAVNIGVSRQSMSLWEMEFRVNHPTRGCIWVKGTAKPESGEDHSTIWYGHIGEITQQKQAEMALKNAKDYYETLLELSSDSVYIVNKKGQLAAYSRSFAESLGYAYKEAAILNKTDWDTQLASETSSLTISKLFHQTSQFTTKHRRKDGSLIDVEVKAKPIFVEGEQLLHCSARDITQQNLLRQALINERNFVTTIIDYSINGVLVTDMDNKIIRVNGAMCEISGYNESELLGNNPSILKSGVHDSAFYQQFWHDLNVKGSWSGEIKNRRRDGTIITSLLNVTSIYDDNGVVHHRAAIFSDITEIEQSREQLDYLAHHDSLTQLPNRLSFIDELDAAVHRADRNESELAIIFFDIDRFKHINDTFGHPQGDSLLEQVAQRLTGIMRGNDVLARLGGDEFVVLIQDIKYPDQTGFIANKILEVFHQSFILPSGLELNVNASLGVAMYPTDGKTTTELLSNADSAMYNAKERGGAQYQYYRAQLTENIKRTLAIESHLRHADERNELFMVYQPQIDTQTNRVSGLEALIRWRNTELGFVPPDEFISVAEDTGLIYSLGDWIFRTVFANVKTWASQGIQFGRVAINLSALQLQKGKIVDTLEKYLNEYGVDPQHIELEITEGVLLKNTDAVITQLHKMRSLGFVIAMDDFGTGFSSLSYLKKLPIQTLKIDQSFIRDIPQDSDNIAITKTIIAMAHSLGLSLIAEGVETEEQAQFLHQHQCYNCQGYLFSKPIPFDEATEFLDSFHAR